jgi:hypothetical protein
MLVSLKTFKNLRFLILIIFRWFCDNQDGPKFVELIFSRLTVFVKKCLEEAAMDGQSLREENYAHPGFVYKGFCNIFKI